MIGVGIDGELDAGRIGSIAGSDLLDRLLGVDQRHYIVHGPVEGPHRRNVGERTPRLLSAHSA